MAHTPSRPVPVSLLALTGVYRFTVAQYRRMVDARVLQESEPCELLDGVIINCPRPHSPPVASTRSCLHRLLGDLPPPGWCFHCIGAITMSESEPEPDFLFVRGDLRTHTHRFPGPEEVGLVGEVADGSLAFDRIEKGRIYAGGAVPTYWLVNVVDRVIEVYTDPDTSSPPPAYRTRTNFAPGQSVPVVLDGVAVATVAVADLLP